MTNIVNGHIFMAILQEAFYPGQNETSVGFRQYFLVAGR